MSEARSCHLDRARTQRPGATGSRPSPASRRPTPPASWHPRPPDARRGRLRRRPPRRDHRGVGTGPRRLPAGRRRDHGRGRRRSGRHAPALRHRAHGTRARLAGTSGATPRRHGRDAGARVVRCRAHVRADADRRHRRGPAVGPARRRGGIDVRPGGVRHRTGRRGAAAHPRRRGPAGSGAARRGRGGDDLGRPRSPVDRGRLLRARVRAAGRWRSTTWPRSGPRRWSGGARRTRSGASTDAAACTAPRSSGCAGRATRRRRRRSWPARSFAPTCGASSGGR